MYLRNNETYMNNTNTLRYLQEDESYIPPYSVPIFESYSMQDNFVNYNDILSYADTYSMSPTTVYKKICESNNVNHLLVCINEEDMIIDNSIFDYFDESQIILRPLSKKDKLYQYLDEACDDYLCGNEEMFDYLEETVTKGISANISNDYIEDIRMGRTNASNDNSQYQTMFNTIQKHINELDKNIDYNSKNTRNTVDSDGKTTYLRSYSKDRKFLGRAVASLRSLYKDKLKQYNMEKDPSKKTMLKSLLAKIMNFIDRIMVKLQNKLS